MIKMHFFERAPERPKRLAILPGTFNPVTVAHVALARAALTEADETVFVLPRVFPHKHFIGATFQERVEMLRTALAGEPAFSIATAEGGLFLEIARECRQAYGPDVRLRFLCGRDAAERIVNWDYGRAGVVEEMLGKFDLLVAHRDGAYEPPPLVRMHVTALQLGESCEGISASEVRRRIAAGEAWEDLVPDAVRERVRQIYGTGRATGRRLQPES